MSDPLNELLAAAQAILPSVRTFDQAERVRAREAFVHAINEAERAVEAQAGPRVQSTIDKSWDMGWDITEYEALIALASVLEFPGRKIAMIKAFRTRTDDGANLCGTTNKLKRAKEIIEVAQEVSEYGI